MESTQSILLNGSRNKKAVNENESLNINFSGNKKLLPEDSIVGDLDSYETYLNERKNCNKFRIILDIHPYCSNVLFNPFTEIVMNEGSGDVTVLNYLEPENSSGMTGVIGKPNNFVWTNLRKVYDTNTTQSIPSNYEAVRDTQLSNLICGFDYHCGIDIFNNHILRNKVFKAVNYNEINSNTPVGSLRHVYGKGYTNVRVNEAGTPHVYLDGNFNTIDDYMRDINGWVISENFPRIVPIEQYRDNNKLTIVFPLHLYQDYDIYSFNDCIRERLIEKNGWYGFSNTSTINSITLQNTTNHDTDEEVVGEREMDINKVINNRLYCDFIDLYPGKDLYSFTPKYNEHRRRLEHNWDYCLTYPSENIIRMDEHGRQETDFPFFNIDSSGNTSLKAHMFDEYTVNDDGVSVLTVYSICQHGLMEGDRVNIYKNEDLEYESSEVHVIDKYIFQVTKKVGNMSNMWVTLDDFGDGVYDFSGKSYPICESRRCNIDPNAQNIHFRRVLNNVECKYYVRKFSRLPNFKFRDEEVNDYTLYDDNHIKHSSVKRRFGSDNLPLIKRFSLPDDNTCGFENHISKLGFASTSYGDDVTEIVYTDDIDVSYLRDNLGRPISDIFFTVVKRNGGYKEWYGIGTEHNESNESVEYSHCFGKNNCSFLLSDYYRFWCKHSPGNERNTELEDVRDITSTNQKGIKMFTTTQRTSHNNKYIDIIRDYNVFNDDEIVFDNMWSFYGDICCYSPSDCNEQSIQMSMNRFNTVQRELSDIAGNDTITFFNNGQVVHDEIRDVENNIAFSDVLRQSSGDPFNLFILGNGNFFQHTTAETLNNQMRLREGYYYQAHYKIQLKNVSDSLTSVDAEKYEIIEIADLEGTIGGRKLFGFKTLNENNFLKNQKCVLYKYSTNECFYVTVYEMLDSFTFSCVIANENGDHVDNIDGIFDIKNIDDYIILKKHEDTPYYANIIRDGSCRFQWRKIEPNGMDEGENAYPFTNGALYITKQINFFLRRQDPQHINRGWHISDISPIGEVKEEYKGLRDDNYFSETQMRSC